MQGTASELSIVKNSLYKYLNGLTNINAKKWGISFVENCIVLITSALKEFSPFLLVVYLEEKA